MIRIKRVYDPPSSEDGIRVLCTKRWPRGVRRGATDRWMPELGTPPELLGPWLAGTLDPEEFRVRMRIALRNTKARACIEELATLVRQGEAIALLTSVRDLTRTHLLVVQEEIEQSLRPV